MGLLAGALQGSAGASGPLIAVYLFGLGLERLVFLFSINALFFVLDTTQCVTLRQSGLIAGGRRCSHSSQQFRCLWASWPDSHSSAGSTTGCSGAQCSRFWARSAPASSPSPPCF